MSTEPRGRSWITRELDLTAEQREQMREIWSGVMGASRQQQRDRRRAIREERDQAMQNLFSEDRKTFGMMAGNLFLGEGQCMHAE